MRPPQVRVPRLCGAPRVGFLAAALMLLGVIASTSGAYAATPRTVGITDATANDTDRAPLLGKPRADRGAPWLAAPGLDARPGYTAGTQPSGSTPPAPQAPVCVSATVVQEPCQAWASTYDGPARGFDAAGALFSGRIVGTSPDSKTIYALGSSQGAAPGNHYDLIVLAYDAATGERRWATRYAGPSDLPEATATGLAVSSTGGTVLVTGSVTTRDYKRQAVTVLALAADSGRQLWSRIQAEPGYTTNAPSVALSPDGNQAYLVAQVYRANSDGSFSGYGLTIGYDASTGGQLWRQQDVAEGGLTMLAGRVAASSDGKHLYVAGGEIDSQGLTVASVLLVYNVKTPALLTRTRQPMSGYTVAGLVVSPDGRRVFVEHANAPRPLFSNQALTFAYDAEGNPLWNASYRGGDAADCSTRPWYSGPLAVTADGSKVIVTSLGGCPSSEVTGFNTVAYDTATGTRAWAATLSVNLFDCICGPAVAVDPSGGNIYVTGLAHAAVANYDTTTVAYDASTGTQRWLVSHPEGRNSPSDVTVTPDGSRIVVAASRSLYGLNSVDILMLAYAPAFPYGQVAPPASVPEVPVSVLLPLLAAGVMGGGVWLRRRRTTVQLHPRWRSFGGQEPEPRSRNLKTRPSP